MRAVKVDHDRGSGEGIVVLDESTGQRIDFELNDSVDDVLARLASDDDGNTRLETPRRGRPRLGVTSREVTLLPRHWDWLTRQPGGASGTLRRLVDSARKSPDARHQQALAAADRFMTVVAGDLPNYEDASRALYAGDTLRFDTLIAEWPEDVHHHSLRLASVAFDARTASRSQDKTQETCNASASPMGPNRTELLSFSLLPPGER